MLGDGDTEPVGQFARDLSTNRDIPTADKQRGDRGDYRVEAGLDAPLDPPQVCFGRRNILLSREQKRDVYWNAGRSLPRSPAILPVPVNLDEEVGFALPLVEIARGGQGALAIVGEKG
jgi:hypothetical protein